MSFLRSNLCIAILSLFVLAAYGFEVLDDHCDEVKHEQTHQGETDDGSGVPDSGADGCQCICHGGYAAPVVDRLRGPATEPALIERFVIRDEIPPETVPLGIDYPPQLA